MIALKPAAIVASLLMSSAALAAEAKITVLYAQPKSAEEFDKHYFEKHVPIAKTIPGLRKYEVNRGPVLSPAGATGVHLVAILTFDDMAAVQAAFASAEGQAAASDVQRFATGGVDMMFYDTKEV